MLFLFVLMLVSSSYPAIIEGLPSGQIRQSHLAAALSQQSARLIYRLHLNQSLANNGLVHVTISYSLSSPSTSFTMSPVGGWYDPIEIRGFTATDGKDAQLPVRYNRDSSDNRLGQSTRLE